MHYPQTTQVPNIFFDQYLSSLSEAETKVLLAVIRQTFGWIDRRTGKRKERDRISNKWFVRRTGLSKRTISKAIASLCFKKLILITDYQGNVLFEGEKRKGKSLYYSVKKEWQLTTVSSARKVYSAVHRTAHNKTNILKTNTEKLSVRGWNHVSKFLHERSGDRAKN